MKYFAIERDDECFEPVILIDKNGNTAFEDLMNMSYDDMKNYDKIDNFVMAVMDATNQLTGGEDANTAVTLVGEDDVFIWGLIIGPSGEDEFHYVFVDWKKDGNSYKYEK